MGRLERVLVIRHGSSVYAAESKTLDPLAGNHFVVVQTLSCSLEVWRPVWGYLSLKCFRWLRKNGEVSNTLHACLRFLYDDLRTTSIVTRESSYEVYRQEHWNIRERVAARHSIIYSRKDPHTLPTSKIYTGRTICIIRSRSINIFHSNALRNTSKSSRFIRLHI